MNPVDAERSSDVGRHGSATMLAIPTSSWARPLWPLLLAVAVIVVALVLPGRGIPATYGNQTSSDEPHYLLTALSLGEDGDLDIANQVDRGAYRPFHEQGLLAQAATDPTGREVVPHDPLLPALLAIPMVVGGWWGAKTALAIMAGALAAATLWVAVRRFGARPVPSAVVVSILCASAPLGIYGTQVYPELPAALALVLGVAAAAGPPSWRADLGTCIAVVALPWLAVKYVPVAATLAVVHLWRRWRQGGRRQVVAMLGGLAAAGVVYVVAHLAWYGGVTAYAAGVFFQDNGAQLSVVGTDPDYPGRARRLVGLWVDRDFGIATWQPMWLLGIGGIAWMARRRPTRAWPLVVAPVVVGWLNATFVALTMQGWWFPGRQLVVVLPLVAVAIASWASTRRSVLVVACFAGIAGVATTLWLLADGLAGRLALIVDFARTSSPVLLVLRPVMPDYFRVTTATWLLHVAWLAVLVGIGLCGWRDAGARVAPAVPDLPEGTA